MERLTYRVNTGINDVVLTDKKSVDECLEWGDVLNRLAEYEDLEEEERLIRLPCNLGDTVYEINRIRNTVSEFIVKSFTISEYGIFVGWVLFNGIYNNLSGFNDSEIGKTVFLTQSEAEAALRVMVE